jgi:CDP-diacylglycerol---glycerol-3-phosphate 3-phosphatidyltransferase
MFDGRWRHAVDRGTQPVGRVLVRAHITADVITALGLVMSVVTAVVVGTGHLLIGVGLLFAVGLPDLFDGPVAKASGTASVRGAFFDSVADRVSDGFLLGGVAWFLAAQHHGEAVLLPFAILAVTSLISYQRAKAELLGLSAKGGLMERAERFILLGLCFIAGSVSAAAFVPSLWIFLGLVLATALGRFVKVIRVAEGPVQVPTPLRTRPSRVRQVADPIGENGSAEIPDLESAHSGHLAEVSRRSLARWREGMSDSRWRAWRVARAQRETAVPRGSWTRRSGEPSVKRRSKRASSGSGEGARIARTRVERRTRPDGRARPER